MSKDYAYIRTKPKEIKFSLPFSDGSGERLVVRLHGKQTDVLIKDVSDEVIISIEDIDWLRQCLDEVKQLAQMPNGITER